MALYSYDERAVLHHEPAVLGRHLEGEIVENPGQHRRDDGEGDGVSAALSFLRHPPRQDVDDESGRKPDDSESRY